MDNWQVAQNYIVAAAIAGSVGGYYYYTAKQRKPNRTGSSAGLLTKRSENELRERGSRRNLHEQTNTQSSSSATVKKRKPKAVPQPKEKEVIENKHEEKPTKESDISTAAFAQQMIQARQGADLSSSKRKEVRVKTVKPRILPVGSPALSTAATEVGTDIDDIEAADAGDVSDMLEPRAAGPATLRITPSEKPQVQRAPRQQKQEVVESKKQRQNRKKIEERKAQQLEDERERKALEERQRRTAREARGEPAKNGLAKAPTSSAWEKVNNTNGAAPVANNHLLDTFDAESTSSSTGGMEASTAATSTTEGEHARSEDDQMAAAIKQSVDESGWTTIAAAKKNKKQVSNGDLAGTTRRENTKTESTGRVKTGGFAALDTGDANGWEA